MRACFQNGIHLFCWVFLAQTFLKKQTKPQHNSPRRWDGDGLPADKVRKCCMFAQHLTSGALKSYCRKIGDKQVKQQKLSPKELLTAYGMFTKMCKIGYFL